MNYHLLYTVLCNANVDAMEENAPPPLLSIHIDNG